MASSSSSKHLSLFFLLLLSSSLQIHARDSQFFSKATPYSTTTHEVKESTDQNNIPHNEVSSFRPDDQEQPNLNQPENQNGYGLYGHDQVDNQFSPTTTNSVHYSTSTNLPAGDNFARENYQFNNNNNGYETKQNSLSDPRYQENGNNYGYNSKQNSFNEPRYQENGNNYNNNGYKTEEYSGNNNGYRSEQYNNFNNNDGYKREQYRSSSSNNKKYPAEKQGMSDTRFMENGRYYRDINSENSYPNEYQNSRDRGASREYGSSNNRGVEGRNQYYNNNNNGGYSYGNNRNPNEFSRNSMVDQYQSNEENFENQEFDP